MLQVVDFSIKCICMSIFTSSVRSIVETLNTQFEFIQAIDTSAFICSPSMRHVIRVVKMCVASHRHGVLRLTSASVCSNLSSIRPHFRCSRKRRRPAPLEHVTKHNRERREPVWKVRKGNRKRSKSSKVMIVPKVDLFWPGGVCEVRHETPTHCVVKVSTRGHPPLTVQDHALHAIHGTVERPRSVVECVSL